MKFSLYSDSAANNAFTARLIARAWETPQLLFFAGGLFIVFLLTSFSGFFFREEDVPIVQLGALALVYISGILLAERMHQQQDLPLLASYGMEPAALKKTLWIAPLLYVVSLPLFFITGLGWNLFLYILFGIEPTLQPAAELILLQDAWIRGLYIFSAILVVPLFEELLFRGILFPYFVKKVGLVRALLFVSLFFAAMHFHLPSFLPLMLLGALLSLAYWRVGSLWVCIGLHAIFNGVSIVALYLLV